MGQCQHTYTHTDLCKCNINNIAVKLHGKRLTQALLRGLERTRIVCTLLSVSVPHRNALKLLEVSFYGDSNTFKIVELSITNRIWGIWGLRQNKDQHLKIHGNKDKTLKATLPRGELPGTLMRGNTFISCYMNALIQPEWKQTDQAAIWGRACRHYGLCFWYYYEKSCSQPRISVRKPSPQLTLMCRLTPRQQLKSEP